MHSHINGYHSPFKVYKQLWFEELNAHFVKKTHSYEITERKAKGKLFEQCAKLFSINGVFIGPVV